MSLPIDVDAKSKTSQQKRKIKRAKKKAKSRVRAYSKCDRNYRPCVPVASDVDCKPGSGNGPKYITRRVKVIKKDVYRLDGDRDGWGCERN